MKTKNNTNGENEMIPQTEEWRPFVGDIIYFEDITDPSKRIPANFRGFNGEDAVIIWNGSQMSISKNRLHKHK